MVFFAIEFQQFGPKVQAHILEYVPQGLQDGRCENSAAILCYEYEVHMQVENAVPSRVNIV